MRHQLISRGFSILEWLSTLVIVGLLIYIGLISHRYYQTIDNRGEATQGLQEIAKTQRYFYRQNGRYGTTKDIWRANHSQLPQHYTFSTAPQGDGYIAVAKAVGRQLSDQDCSQIVLLHQQGKVTRYPAICWGQ